jgi:plasmid segregation protein ParM
MKNSIGLDVGRSAVKLSYGDEQVTFPTAAIPAVSLSVDGDSAKGDTVRVGSNHYFVGDTAMIHSNGRVLEGLNDDWIATDEHSALLVAGYQRAIKGLGRTDVNVVLGLPSRLHAAQKERLREVAAATLLVGKENIHVLPQPLAAYFTRVFNRDGTPMEGATDDEKWFVIDIGFYTTDFGMVEKGIWSAAGQESMAGTYVAAGKLKRLIAAKHGIDVSTRVCEEILRTKSIRDQGKVLDLSDLVEEAVTDVARSIIDGAIQVFGTGPIRSAHGIFIAGGGSALMFEAIKAIWPHAVCAENPRLAVSEGMRRYGLALELAKD